MIIISIVSFLLDGIFSVIVDQNSIFLPLFSLVSLLVIYPYLKKHEYIVYFGVVMGLFYDLIYTQTLFFNTLIFGILAISILFFYKYFPINIISTIVLFLFIVIFFRFFSNILLVLLGVISFDLGRLFVSVYSSIIINLIYLVVMHFIIKKFYKKQKKYHTLKK